MMDAVVAPVLQVPPSLLPDSVTLPPLQNEVDPSAVMTGVAGN